MNRIAKPIGPNTVVTGSPADPNGRQASFEILSESGIDDGAFYPAQHVSVYNNESVKAIRDFCNELLTTEKITAANAATPQGT